MSVLRQSIVVAALCVLSIAAYQAVRANPAAARAAAATAHSSLPSFLRFQGTGTVSVRPDLATIDFQVGGSGSTLIDASNQATYAMARVLKAMKDRGVARWDMQTNGVNGSCDQRTGTCSAGEGVTVTVRRVAITGQLIAAGIDAGATASYGPSFSSNERAAAQRHALGAAVANARLKAEAAAAAAGLHLGGVVSVAESNPQPYYYPGPFDGVAASFGDKAASVPIRLGRQLETATVTVVFAYSS